MGSKRFRGSILLCLLVGLIAALVIAGCGGGSSSSSSSTTETTEEAKEPAETEAEPETAENEGIAAAPEFTSEELYEPAGANWVTNGGGTTNDRFSTLSEINTENVKELKGDWMTKIGSNATSAKFSAEGQALEYNGTIYISDGADDAFAMNASNGEVLWTYEPHLPPDPLGEIVCCGWDNRGLAIGDGMVFVSQLNGDEVALDQETGKVKWNTEVVKPGSGFSITSAPLYYNGKVYVGGSGGEYGVRGRLTALDATTGKFLWHFWTTPSPKETGGDTWPNNGSYKHGGASIWNTPTVNPKTGMLFFSTSNAAPWVGAKREGENLFTASIVGLDAETGKYHCHFQEVHHDLWDYDAPSPTVLMKGMMNGKEVEAVGEPEKTGWAYVVDQENCKPVYPIPEVKVPQDPSQKTWPTQPEPTMEPFSPVTKTDPAAVKKAAEGVVGQKPEPKVVGVPDFTPMSSDPNVMNVVANAAVGGDNWPPSSYDPEENMYFVCSQAGVLGLIVPPNEQKYKEGETYIGSDEITASGSNTPGFLTAYDMSTGKIAWQDHFKESCYSGAVTTAGGLVFVGQDNGELQAFNVENGEELWHWQTGAGANTTVTPFEDEGEEKIAIYAGGNSLAATPHGEAFWVFSLKGTMEEAKGLEEKAEGTKHAGEKESEQKGAEEEAAPPAKAGEGGESGEEAEAGGGGGATADAAAGKEVFSENCSVCHGATGHGGNGGPDLRTMPKAKEQAGAEEQVTDGGGGMPAFKGQLSSEEISNVAAYVVEEIVGK
ncbi:MAG: quinonprotein alcohol dehydrogenase [Solirubrobacterales bacterium]|nr:quinonprotein alcohol dehydrogenase [Solirubrobacterales bacterium]